MEFLTVGLIWTNLKVEKEFTCTNISRFQWITTAVKEKRICENDSFNSNFQTYYKVCIFLLLSAYSSVFLGRMNTHQVIIFFLDG